MDAWQRWLMAGSLGILVGLVILLVGLWIDRARDRRWNEELHEEPVITEEYDWALVDGQLKRFPRQRGSED